MDTNPNRGAVVVGVDGSAPAHRALMWAAEEARLRHRPLLVVHAVPPIGAGRHGRLVGAGVSAEALAEEAHVEATRLVTDAADAVAERAGGLEVVTLVREEDPRSALLDLAPDAAMVVLGSRGRGPVKSLLMGSVGLALVRHAAAPVAVVRPAAPDVRREGVLVGTTSDEATLPTLSVGYREAALRAVPLTVVHCDWDADAPHGGWQRLPEDSPGFERSNRWIAESLAGLAAQFPDVERRVVVARGSVDRCLQDLSADHELVVVGRHGASPFDLAGFGSVATPLVEHAHTTVLVVPNPRG
ncbi:MAG: universal stress protein [Marmoricola sp.]